MVQMRGMWHYFQIAVLSKPEQPARKHGPKSLLKSVGADPIRVKINLSNYLQKIILF